MSIDNNRTQRYRKETIIYPRRRVQANSENDVLIWYLYKSIHFLRSLGYSGVKNIELLFKHFQLSVEHHVLFPWISRDGFYVLLLCNTRRGVAHDSVVCVVLHSVPYRFGQTHAVDTRVTGKY